MILLSTDKSLNSISKEIEAQTQKHLNAGIYYKVITLYTLKSHVDVLGAFVSRNQHLAKILTNGYIRNNEPF